MMKKSAYFDYNATTPICDESYEKMDPFLRGKFANPASPHQFGMQMKVVVEKCREELIKNIDGEGDQSLIFTSGTTESNHLAILGSVYAMLDEKIHVITQKTEHACVLGACDLLEKQGHEVTYLNVNPNGEVSLNEFETAFKENTKLVSIMTANNEVGTIHNIKKLVEITRKKSKALFHTDAAQAIGKIPFSAKDLDVDLISFSAHKMYGPKGIGALYITPRRPKIQIKPLFLGGGHEFGMRSGTLNVPGIVGFSAALKFCLAKMNSEEKRLKDIQGEIVKVLFSELDLVTLNGSKKNRLCNNLNFTVLGVDADKLIQRMSGYAFSSGSACSTLSTKPSHVLLAMGKTEEEAKSSIRLGFGIHTNEDDTKSFLKELIHNIKELRKNSLVYEMLKNS